MTDTTQTTAAPPATTTPPTPWYVLPGLASLVVVGLTIVSIWAFLSGDPTLRPVMATAWVALANQVVGYFFGSSAGSQKKDDNLAAASAALANSAPAIAPVTPTAPPASASAFKPVDRPPAA